MTYNSEKYIKVCLDSVYQDPLTPLQGETLFLKTKRLQVVVVDNSSRDSTVQVVQDNFSQVKVIRNTRNRGFAKAVNQGIRVCLKNGCRYVLILNPDTKLEKGALSEMLVTLKRDKARAVVQPLLTLMKDPGKINTSGNRYRGFGLVTLGEYQKEVPNAKFQIPNRKIDYASGACMLIKSSVFDHVGFFDEGFFLYFEDTEFSKRVREAGYEIWLAAKARVQHDYKRPYAFNKLKWFLSGWWQYVWKGIKVSSDLDENKIIRS